MGWPCTGSGTKSSGGAQMNASPDPTSSGAVAHEVAVEAHEVATPLEAGNTSMPPKTIGPSVVEPEMELGDDAEVAAAAPQTPEEVGVLVGRRGDDPAVGGDDLGLEQVVAHEAELALEPAAAAAEREARDPGRRRPGRPSPRGRAPASRHRSRPTSRRPRRVAMRAVGSTVDARSCRAGRRQTPGVDDRRAGHTVTAAVHRRAESPLAGAASPAATTSFGVRAPRDHRGAPIDHAVEDACVRRRSRRRPGGAVAP